MSSSMTTTATPLTSRAKPVLAVPVEKSTILKEDVLSLMRPPTSGVIPKGRNASGRNWKARPQKRASSLVKTRINNQSRYWEEHQAEKLARKQTIQLQTEMEQEKREEIAQRKARRLENEKRKAENEFKNIQKSVQTLNTNKVGTMLKAMSKKQLRQIKKTMVNPKTGVVEYVSPYAK